jgi:hypothetical protein
MHLNDQVELAGVAARQRGLKIISRPRSELKPDLATRASTARNKSSKLQKHQHLWL